MNDHIRPTSAYGLAAGVVLATLLAAPAFAAHHEDGSDKMTAGTITVTESKTIAAPAADVWAVVRDFDGLANWHPAVASSEISEGENNTPGAVRYLMLADDGGAINEKLTDWDDDGMQYSYRIVDGVLPVAHYASTISVSAEGEDTSRLTWRGQFDAAEGTSDEDARGVITNVYRAGLTTVRMQITGEQ